VSDPLRAALRELVEASLAWHASDSPHVQRIWIKAISNAQALLDGTRCAYCGKYVVLNDGLVPYHDYPPPCRSVCRGSKNLPLVEGAPPEIEQIDPKSLVAVFAREDQEKR
jgi:hypothetical protein